MTVFHTPVKPILMRGVGGGGVVGRGNANESTDLRSPDVGISGSICSICVWNGLLCPIHVHMN